MGSKPVADAGAYPPVSEIRKAMNGRREELIGWFDADPSSQGQRSGLYLLVPPAELLFAAIALVFFGLNAPDFRIGVTDRGLHFLRRKWRTGKVEHHAFFEYVLIRNFTWVEKRGRYRVEIDFAFGKRMKLWVKKTPMPGKGDERPLPDIFDYVSRHSRVSGE